MRNAMVQIYTGDGKGKTTAAIGLCLRALGRGLRAVVAQFRKGMESGERASAEKLGLPVLLCKEGRGSPPCSKPCKLLMELNNIINEEAPGILVLDEIMAALRSGCAAVEEVTALLDRLSGRTEIVMTGRGAPAELLDRADLITSMEAVKHCYAEGVKARRGIEY